MTNKALDNLINDLSEELKPVKPLSHPVLRMLPWFFMAIIYVLGVASFAVGFRFDLQEKLEASAYIFEMSLVLFLMVSSGLASAWLSVPDIRGQKWVLSVPLTLLTAFTMFVGAQVYTDGADMPVIEFHYCVRDALLFGIVPMLFLFFLVRQGATTRAGWMSFMSVLSVGSLSWMALRTTCAMDTVGHLFMYHFLPFVFVGAVLGILARRIYHW